MSDNREHELLLEIARLHAALIRVVPTMDEPLKAEIATVIWPVGLAQYPPAPRRTPRMLARIPPWLRAALITGGQALIGSLLLIVLSLIADVNDWLSDPTNPVDISGPAKLVIAAAVTFVTFLVTAAYRAFRPPQNTYPEPLTKVDVPPPEL